MHMKTCEFSAWNGHLKILKYSHENGCPWDEDVYSAACRNESYSSKMEIIDYLDKKCPGEYVCYSDDEYY